MTPGSDAPEHGAAPKAAYVHVRVGVCDMAIAVAHVVQAVPVPEAGLVRLPRREGALLGLLAYGAAAVPVVSLDRWVPMGSPESPTQARILILRDNEAWVGIEVDAILGVKAIELDAIRRVHHHDSDAELFESVATPTAARPLLSLLEVHRLMKLCDIWCSDAGVEKASNTGGAVAQLAARTRHAVFSVGGDWWAIPATAIERVVPAPVPELEMRRGNKRVGICQWEGRKLPLVDISDTSHATPDPAPWMVVVERGGHAMGLAVQACQELIDIGEKDLTRLCDAEVQAGIAIWPALGQVRVLDIDKLFASIPETSIHSSSVAKTAAAAAQAASALTTDSPYIVFEADRPYASHVQQIVGIVELPAATIDDLLAGNPAAMNWRGQVIRVVNMPAINGVPATLPQPRLAVLARSGDDDPTPLGIAIHRLTNWIPARSVETSSMRMGSVGEFNMITLPGAHKASTLVVVDFAQMALLLS